MKNIVVLFSLMFLFQGLNATRSEYNILFKKDKLIISKADIKYLKNIIDFIDKNDSLNLNINIRLNVKSIKNKSNGIRILKIMKILSKYNYKKELSLSYNEDKYIENDFFEITLKTCN